MTLTDFGVIVRKARIDARLSQASMAKAIGVSAAYLSGVEIGTRPISQEVLGKAADFMARLGVDRDDVIRAAGQSTLAVKVDLRNVPADRRWRIVRLLRKMAEWTGEDIAMAEKVAESMQSIASEN